MPIDPAILSATSGLIGSLIGGVSTFSAYWLTQSKQLRTQILMQQAAQRELLYAEFIVEASKRFAEAWGHQAEGPVVAGGLFSAIERMRLTSSDAVITAAQRVIRRLIETYTGPDRSFEELIGTIQSEQLDNPLKDFSEACRAELDSLRLTIGERATLSGRCAHGMAKRCEPQRGVVLAPS